MDQGSTSYGLDLNDGNENFTQSKLTPGLASFVSGALGNLGGTGTGLDIVGTSFGGSGNNMEVYLRGTATPTSGNPLGYGLAPSPPVTADHFTSSVAIGDLNGDGLNDIVVGNEASASVTVFTKDAGDPGYTGTNIPTGGSATQGTGATSVAIGDLQGTGHAQDIAVLNADTTVTLLLKNQGAPGFFTVNLGTPLGKAANDGHIVIGDLQGTGRAQDFAITEPGIGKAVLYLKDRGESANCQSTFGDTAMRQLLVIQQAP